MSVKYYSFAEYKRIANRLLQKHGMLTVKKLPIDIELLIDKAGYSIHPISGMYKDYGVKGAVLKRTGGYDIAIDENTYETQEFFFRTTLAEELSHIILHEEYVAGIKNLDDVIKFHKSFDDEDYKRIEQQARCLGSQLLLPSELFDDEVLKWELYTMLAISQDAVIVLGNFSCALKEPSPATILHLSFVSVKFFPKFNVY